MAAPAATGDAAQDASSTNTAPSAPTVSAGSAAEGPMGSLIDQLTGGAPLGTTEVGKAWCLKALHPADSNVLSSPMPTNETRSIASVGFNQMDLLSIPPSFDPTKTWNLQLYVHRDPCLLYSMKASQAGHSDILDFVFSRQISNAADYPTSFNNLRENCEKYRITSQSLTGYFDGASLSDQGHVVVAQSDLPRLCAPRWTSDLPINDMGVHMPVTWYPDPVPTYDLILQTTRAYQGNAKEGFYAPSKLINLGQWVSTNQAWLLIGSSAGFAKTGTLFSRYATDQVMADQPLADFLGTFPFTRLLAADPAITVFAQPDTSLTSVFYTGISATSSIRLTMRWTMDMIVRPGTNYAPFTKMPPPEDSGALRMYAEISRRMSDSYPSSHNNLAMLLPVIGKLAATLAPSILSKLPGWLSSKFDYARKKPGSSVWSLLDPLSAAEYARGTELSSKIDRTSEEDAELHAIAAKTSPSGFSSVLPAASNFAAQAIRALNSTGSSGYTPRRRTTYRRRSYPSSSYTSFKRRRYSRPYQGRYRKYRKY